MRASTAAIFLLFHAGITWAGEVAPLEDYAIPVEVNGLHLSPSGKRLTYHWVNDDKEVVPVIEVATGRVLQSMGIEKSVLEQLALVRDDLLFLAYEYPKFHGDAGEVGRSHLKTLNIETGRLLRLGDPSRYTRAMPEWYLLNAAGISPGREFLYLPGWTRPYIHQMNLYLYDLDHGLRPRPQAVGTGNTVQWVAKGEDDVFVREDFDYKKNRHTVVVIEDDEERVLYSKDVASREIDIIGATADWQSLVFRTQRPGKEGISYHLMSLLDGSTGGPLFERQAGSALKDESGAIVGFESRQGPAYSYRFLDEALAKRFTRASQSFPGANVRFVSASQDRKQVVVRVSGDWSAAYYMMLSDGVEKPVMVVREEKKVPRAHAVPREVHHYVDETGRPVRALVTVRPEVQQEGEAPAIILTNWRGNDFSGVDASWIAQYFASRGYVVVQPEVRGFQFNGSFSPQGTAEWRAAPEEDADVVVAGLASSGVIDTDRMCVIGIGNGAFTALTLAYRSAYELQCVGALNALTDLSPIVSRFRDRYQHNQPAMKYLQRRLGFDSTNRDSIDERSPETHASAISAAVLLAYFEKSDEIVERQAKHMVRKLENATLLRMMGDDVRLLKKESRTEFLTALDELVSENLPP